MYKVREHKFGSDPVVTQSTPYLDNAKAVVSHAVRCYQVNRWSISILGPKEEIYTLCADLTTWEVSEKM